MNIELIILPKFQLYFIQSRIRSDCSQIAVIFLHENDNLEKWLVLKELFYLSSIQDY